jgi:hypothetical protein
MAGKKLEWGKEYNWVDTHADPLGYDPDEVPAVGPGEFSASFNGIPAARDWAKQIANETKVRPIAFQSSDSLLHLEEINRLRECVSEMHAHVRLLNQAITKAKADSVSPRLSAHMCVIRTKRFGAACSTLSEVKALRDLFRLGIRNAQAVLVTLVPPQTEAQA